MLLLRQLKKADLNKQVKVINDGQSALEFLMGSEARDLVAMFLDLRLPKVSGIALLEKIRLHEPIRHLPVIVMTSSNSPQDLQKCSDLGISSYVQKPVTFTAFTKAIADTFHRPDSVKLAPTMQMHE